MIVQLREGSLEALQSIFVTQAGVDTGLSSAVLRKDIMFVLLLCVQIILSARQVCPIQSANLCS